MKSTRTRWSPSSSWREGKRAPDEPKGHRAGRKYPDSCGPGRATRALIVDHAATVNFFAPDVAYADARKYLPALLEKRGVPVDSAMTLLDRLEPIVQPLEVELYAAVQVDALRRIAVRDADDWPVLACAMVIGCPVWTEDADFFGCGVAIWTSDRVTLYLRS